MPRSGGTLMPKLPDDDFDLPPGAAPGLRVPSDAALARAKPIFERLLAGGARPKAGPSSKRAFGGGRRYDVALSLVVGLDDAPDVDEAGPVEDEVTPVDTDAFADAVTQVHIPWGEVAADDEPTSPGRPVPNRPPAGAPTVRKSVARPPAPASSPTQLPGSKEDTAVIYTDEAGNRTFQINFHDDVFSHLACSVAFIDGRVVATFTVQDDNTRRLLEAEKGRLRASLESRGLRVQDVRVVRATDEG
jgi:hypothetical protein